jgi:hypothetical protein
MTATATTYSRNKRISSFYGNEEFSDFMYDFVNKSPPKGFVYVDCDGILRNHLTEKIGILEVKKMCGQPTYAQTKTWEVFNGFFSTGHFQNYQYVGFFLLVFENTCFHDGRAKLNGQEITSEGFEMFLRINF